jgi:hypothetical protein
VPVRARRDGQYSTELVHCLAQVLGLKMAVDSRRRAHTAMTQETLRAMRVDAGAQKQRRSGVPVMPRSA